MAQVPTMRILEEMEAPSTLRTVKVNGSLRAIFQTSSDLRHMWSTAIELKRVWRPATSLTLTTGNLNARPIHLFPNTQIQRLHVRKVRS